MKQKKDLVLLMPALGWGATSAPPASTSWYLQGPVTGASLRDAKKSLALERQSWSADWRKGSRRRLGNLNLR